MYGYTHGSPNGVNHFTGSPVSATIFAHFANHSFILFASLPFTLTVDLEWRFYAMSCSKFELYAAEEC